jgi:hypothetical protein
MVAMQRRDCTAESAVQSGHHMNRRRRAVHLASALAGVVLLAACAVGIRSDRAAIGGGPDQATQQAQIVYRSTVTAFATVNALNGPTEPCTCDSSGK